MLRGHSSSFSSAAPPGHAPLPLGAKYTTPAGSHRTRNCRKASLEYVDCAHRSATSRDALNARTRSTRQSRGLYSMRSSDRLFSTHAGPRMARVLACALTRKAALLGHPRNGRTVAEIAISRTPFLAVRKLHNLYMSHKVRANAPPTSHCDCAMALVRCCCMAPVCQGELGEDQRRNGSRKNPAPSPLQRALKQE